MSLTVDGVWRAGVWASTVWGDCVWYEPGCAVAVSTPTPESQGGGAVGWSYHKKRKQKLLQDDEEIFIMIAMALPELIRRYPVG